MKLKWLLLFMSSSYYLSRGSSRRRIWCGTSNCRIEYWL